MALTSLERRFPFFDVFQDFPDERVGHRDFTFAKGTRDREDQTFFFALAFPVDIESFQELVIFLLQFRPPGLIFSEFSRACAFLLCLASRNRSANSMSRDFME